MLVTHKEVLDIAEKEEHAIGAFNVPNLECLMAVIQSDEAYYYAQLELSVYPVFVN